MNHIDRILGQGHDIHKAYGFTRQEAEPNVNLCQNCFDEVPEGLNLCSVCEEFFNHPDDVLRESADRFNKMYFYANPGDFVVGK